MAEEGEVTSSIHWVLLTAPILTLSGSMKGPTLALFLFSVLLTAVQARSRETVKLCGLDYVRTVVYICASSQWRRHLEEAPPTQRGNWAHTPHFSPQISLFKPSPSYFSGYFSKKYWFAYISMYVVNHQNTRLNLAWEEVNMLLFRKHCTAIL